MWDTRVRSVPEPSSPLSHALTLGSQNGGCMQVLDAHSDVVTALAWLPDGTGFISGGLDRKIILWVRVFCSIAQRVCAH